MDALGELLSPAFFVGFSRVAFFCVAFFCVAFFCVAFFMATFFLVAFFFATFFGREDFFAIFLLFLPLKVFGVVTLPFGAAEPGDFDIRLSFAFFRV